MHAIQFKPFRGRSRIIAKESSFGRISDTPLSSLLLLLLSFLSPENRSKLVTLETRMGEKNHNLSTKKILIYYIERFRGRCGEEGLRRLFVLSLGWPVGKWRGKGRDRKWEWECEGEGMRAQERICPYLPISCMLTERQRRIETRMLLCSPNAGSLAVCFCFVMVKFCDEGRYVESLVTRAGGEEDM